MALKLYHDSSVAFFGGQPKVAPKDYEPTNRPSYVEKFIEPENLDVFRLKNRPSIQLPPRININLDKDPKLKYRSTRKTPEYTEYEKFVHIGQRKLGICEIQHLTSVLDSKDEHAVVIYAGSAPTNKQWLEHLLFPNVKFLLVDPNMFNIYITNYRDSHYYHAENGKIVYFGTSSTNFNSKYEVTDFSIKYFDGQDTKVIPNKYNIESLDVIGQDGDHTEYYKYFYESDNCIFINEHYFGNGTAEFCKNLLDYRQNVPEFKNCKTIFWADLRTSEGGSDGPSDLDILWNLSMMYNWCRMIIPDYSMLKFRCPFMNKPPKSLDYKSHQDDFDLSNKLGNDMEKMYMKTGNIEYFVGDIYTQCWAGRQSAETRLWIKGTDIQNNNLVGYDRIKYEEVLFYYNCIERVGMIHTNPLANKDIGFDHCGDCSIEAQVWLAYKTKMDPDLDPPFWINWLGEITTRSLTRGGHGKLGFIKFIGAGGNIPYYEQMIDDEYQELYKKYKPVDELPPRIKKESNISSKIICNYYDIDFDAKMTNNNAIMLNKEMAASLWRRRLAGEILFNIQHLIATVGNKPAVVVYPASANNTFVYQLSLMFPNIKWILIDYNPFKINISDYGDLHYYHAGPSPIVYLSLYNNSAEIEKLKALSHSIKFYDGVKEQILTNKLEHKMVKINPKIDYSDYILKSSNKIFILEQFLDISTIQFVKKLVTHIQLPCLFWCDARKMQVENSKGKFIGYDEPTMFTYGLLYNCLNILKPDFAAVRIRPVAYITPVYNYTDIWPTLELAKSLGNDIYGIHQITAQFNFYKGEFYTAPYGSRYGWLGRLWINGEDIKNNTLELLNKERYIEDTYFYNIIERFSYFYQNDNADSALGFDHCGDCSLENYILDLYRQKIDPKFTVKQGFSLINKITGRMPLDSIHGYFFKSVKKHFSNLIGIDKLITPEYLSKVIDTIIRPTFSINTLIEPVENTLINLEHKNFITNRSRRLAISNIYHLTKILSSQNEHCYLVYTGSAVDTCIYKISQLFPNTKFILIDDRMFNIVINNVGQYHYGDKKSGVVYLETSDGSSPTDAQRNLNVLAFDGKKETFKDAYRQHIKINTDHLELYQKYIRKSSNKIFILETKPTIQLMKFISKLVRPKHSAKIVYWNHFDQFSDKLGITLNASKFFNFTTIINPDYAKTNFDLINYNKDLFKIDPNLANKDLVYSTSEGYDVLYEATNNNKFSFLDGKIKKICWVVQNRMNLIFILSVLISKPNYTEDILLKILMIL